MGLEHPWIFGIQSRSWKPAPSTTQILRDDCIHFSTSYTVEHDEKKSKKLKQVSISFEKKMKTSHVIYNVQKTSVKEASNV